MKVVLKKSNKQVIDVAVKRFTFSGGEVHVVLDEAIQQVEREDVIEIHTEIRSSEDMVALELVKDAVERSAKFKVVTKLIMLYVPYARQDRACEAGEAFSLAVFARRLNALEFNEVIVADPHSDVTPALIKNITIIPQERIVKCMLDFYINQMNFALVSPDGGALKKIFKVAKELGGVDVFCAEKIRDTSNGAILRTEIPVQDFEGRHLIIVDDICDGGRTFVELAKILRERNAGIIDLYATHGIFSRGLDNLENLIQNVHSLNVWEDNLENSEDRTTSTYLVRNQEIVKQQLLKEIL